MTHHPVRAELEAYVAGELDAGALPAFEAHVATCSGCSRALASEAKLELGLTEVAALGKGAAPGVRRLVFRPQIAVPLAAAAAVLVVILPSLTRRAVPPVHHPSRWIGRCVERPTAECISRAGEEGVFLRSSGAEVPLYDAVGSEPVAFPEPALRLGDPE